MADPERRLIDALVAYANDPTRDYDALKREHDLLMEEIYELDCTEQDHWVANFNANCTRKPLPYAYSSRVRSMARDYVHQIPISMKNRGEALCTAVTVRFWADIVARAPADLVAMHVLDESVTIYTTMTHDELIAHTRNDDGPALRRDDASGDSGGGGASGESEIGANS